MTQREIAALRQCESHPNIVTLHEVYADQVFDSYIVSMLNACPGRSLFTTYYLFICALSITRIW